MHCQWSLQWYSYTPKALYGPLLRETLREKVSPGGYRYIDKVPQLLAARDDRCILSSPASHASSEIVYAVPWCSGRKDSL
jgi:hypothetical protein